MCGRFEIHSAIEIILKIFQVDSIDFDLKPSYNIAPSQEIAIVVKNGKNRLVQAKWGFVPGWSKDFKSGYRMINARAETVATSRAFSDAFRSQRCIVPADGFFEWRKTDKTRKPVLVRLKSCQPMPFAGIYSVHSTAEGEEIRTAAIITVNANEAVAPVHDRMPAILGTDDLAAWLDPHEQEPGKLMTLLKPYPAEEMEVFSVTPKMNSYKYDDPENITPIN